MRIAIAQINFHIGNFKANFNQMLAAIEAAKSDNAEVIVFSELAVCGYPPLDLLEHREFVDGCLNIVDRLAEKSHDIAIVVGSPSINPHDRGKKLFNTAFFLSDGEVSNRVNKTLLPTYDIFDEYRYFEPNDSFTLVEYKDKKFALTICEDLWDDQPVENSFSQSKLYRKSPMEELIKQSPDFIINISASPFAANKLNARREVMSQNARQYGLPLIYVNQVGANTELLFDGGSMLMNADGDFDESFDPFASGVKVYDLDNLSNSRDVDFVSVQPILSEEYRLEMIRKALVFGIKDYFSKVGFKQATLGLSGRIDSALTLVLAVEALGAENVHVLLLPSKYSSDHSISDSEEMVRILGIDSSQITIQPIVNEVENQLAELFEGTTPGLAEENIQARVRGLLLMALSNKFGHILLNTSNKSETAVGYSTLYGDLNGGLSVLGDLYKTDVYLLSNHINRDGIVVPESIITKPPSAELRPDQKDSDSLPDYDVLDKVLYAYIEQRMNIEDIIALGYDSEMVEKTVRLVNRSEYKRFQAPPILRISSKAFGIGRRIPLVALY